MKTMSFAALADRLDATADRIVAQLPMMLSAAGAIIADRAKEKMGHYQDAVGPYDAWAELSPITQAERVREGFHANEPLLRTGALRHAIEFRVNGNSVAIGVYGEAAVVARAQEFGYVNIGRGVSLPPRPFLRPSVLETLPLTNAVFRDAIRDALTDA